MKARRERREDESDCFVLTSHKTLSVDLELFSFASKKKKVRLLLRSRRQSWGNFVSRLSRVCFHFAAWDSGLAFARLTIDDHRRGVRVLADVIVCRAGVVTTMVGPHRLEEQRRRVISQMMYSQAQRTRLLLLYGDTIFHPFYGYGRVTLNYGACDRQALTHLHGVGQEKGLDHGTH